MPKVIVKQSFNCSVDQLFEYFSDPFTVASVVNMPCQVVRYSQDSDKHGVGMVRRVKAGLLPAFEETITQFHPNQRIGYKITKGGILDNHYGQLSFSSEAIGSELVYEIHFDVESRIPRLGDFIAWKLQRDMSRSIAKFAQTVARSD